METPEKFDLRQGARERNQSVWGLPLDYAGLLAPLLADETSWNLIRSGTIENHLAISDELWDVKEDERDRLAQLEEDGIVQERLIASNKVALGRSILTIKQATAEYKLEVRRFDATVRDLLMGAKEFAAQVELEQLALEEIQTELGIDREKLHQQEVTAKVYTEIVQQKMVEADVAKSKVEVARAHVEAAMAEVQASEAEVRLIEAQVQAIMAQAEKAELQAQVAMIFADILTRGLAQIRLDVEKQEVAAGFQWIQMKLDDMLNLWDERRAVEDILKTTGAEMLAEVPKVLTAEEAQEDLRLQEATNDLMILGEEKAKTATELASEGGLKQAWVATRIALQNYRAMMTMQQDDKRTWAEQLVQAARRWTYLNQVRIEGRQLKETITISSGN